MKEYIMEMKQFDKKTFGYEQRQELVRCKDCVKRETSACPCSSSGDPYIDWKPDDEWFCADGEAKKND